MTTGMDHAFTTRQARPGDEAAVTDLLQTSYARLMAAHYPRAVLAPALPIIARANPRLLGSETFLVADSAAGAIVGCGGWTPDRPGDGTITAGVGHIRHFATHPDWTRRGIGRALFARTAADARGRGIERLECCASLNAVAFYAALGFRRLRRIDAQLADGVAFPALLMARSLARGGLTVRG